MRWLESFRRRRLTIVVPLHCAAEWVDVVSANIALMPSDARIILSDATLLDPAIDALAHRHRRDARIRVRRARAGLGWRDHANKLLSSVRTELVSILAQDDSITPGYYQRLVDALDLHPTAGLAFGPLEATFDYGTPSARMASPPFPLGEREPWIEALELDARWNFGIPYRGVLRRQLFRPIPETPDDRFADQVWVFSIALVSHLIEVGDAVYIKRYYGDNTHLGWQQLSDAERAEAMRREIEARLSNLAEQRDAALASLGRRFPAA